MSKHAHSSLLLGFIIFILGGCGIAYEYTFSKIASDILGNSVQQWAVVIAIMLFCMGVGAELQKFISSRNIAPTLLYSQLALALLGGFGPFLLLYTFSKYPYNFGLIQYGFTSIIGIIIGFEIPIITRINESYDKNISSNLALVLKMDYIGALVGALVWIFLLPKFFSLHQTAIILGFITLSATALSFYLLKDKLRNSFIFCTCGILCLTSLITGLLKIEHWSLSAEQQLFSDKIVLQHTSKYQHIVVTQSSHGISRCYINGHIQFSSQDEHIYHEMLVHPALQIAEKKQRILVLGGGDGLAVREILKYPEVTEIVLVDLDPLITKLAKEHPIFTSLNNNALNSPIVTTETSQAISSEGNLNYPLPSQKRRNLQHHNEQQVQLQIMNIDASLYIRENIGLFDVIICDFPDPSSPDLAKLYSLNFYNNLKKHLTPGGFIIQQSTSPYHAKEAFLCIGRTMKAAGLSAIPLHQHVPSFGEWGWWIAAHSSHYSKDSIRSKIYISNTLPENTKFLTTPILKSSMSFGKKQLESKKTDITTTAHSAVLHYYLKGWTE